MQHESVQISEKYNRYFFAWLTLIVVFIVANLFVDYAALLALAISVLLVIFQDNTCSYSLMFFLLPFAQIFKISMMPTSLFTIIEMVFIIKRIFMSKLKIKPIFCFLSVLTCFVILISSLISENFSFSELLKTFMYYAILGFFVKDYVPEHYFGYVRCFTIGMLLSSLLALPEGIREKMYMLSGGSQDTTWNSVFGNTNRFSGAMTDANYYVLMLIVVLGLNLVLIFTHKTSCLSKLTVLCLFVFGLFTYSKSYYLLVSILVIIVFYILLINQKIGKFLFGVLCVLAILTFVGTMNFEFIQVMILRFVQSSGNMETFTTGRTLIWRDYWNYISSSYKCLLIGDGNGAPYICGGATHNMYIEIIYKVGIIGLILYLVTFLYPIRIKKGIDKRYFINYFLYFLVGIAYFFLAGFNSYELVFYFISCWMISNLNIRSSNKKNHYGEYCE